MDLSYHSLPTISLFYSVYTPIICIYPIIRITPIICIYTPIFVYTLSFVLLLLLLLLLLLSLLLLRMLQVHGLMEDTYVRFINCRLQLFRSSAYSFSSQYLLLFLKSSRSCVLLLPTPFTSVICPSMAS